MRIRTGFVSNSSSTSFLIISKKALNKADFFNLMGISANSPIASLFAGFYEAVVDNIDREIDFSNVSEHFAIENLPGMRRGRFSDRMLEKLRKAKTDGLRAYYGTLDSETSMIQTFFCTDSFEVENEKIYFNGLECVW